MSQFRDLLKSFCLTRKCNNSTSLSSLSEQTITKPCHFALKLRSKLQIIGTLSKENGDGDGDFKTRKKTGQRRPLWWEFLNFSKSYIFLYIRFSSPYRRFTVRDENVGPVIAVSDDYTSVKATLSETSKAERLISSRTVCRIMASSTEW